jgi:hypothetical protein
MHNFSAFRVVCSSPQAELAVRCQLGRSFGYVSARVRLQGNSAELVETFQTHSMRATRAEDGSFVLWVWLGHEHRELLFVSDRELSATPCSDLPSTQLLDLSAANSASWLCVRPSVVDLRMARLPMGFDRLVGARTDRVDVPVDW